MFDVERTRSEKIYYLAVLAALLVAAIATIAYVLR